MRFIPRFLRRKPQQAKPGQSYMVEGLVDEEWCPQWPIEFTHEAAQVNVDSFAKGSVMRITPLYANPAAAPAAPAVDAQAQDAARFRWLTDDHASICVRVVRNAICERLPVMSYSAACTDIDAAIAAQAAAKGAHDHG